MYILLDTVLATDVNKYSVTIAGCQQRWRTNWIHLYLFLGVDCGVFWTTNHDTAAVRGLVSQPITAYVGHLTWQMSVAITCSGQCWPCSSQCDRAWLQIFL